MVAAAIPAVAVAISAASAVAGTAAAVYGAYQQGQAQKNQAIMAQNQAIAQAQAAEYNAQVQRNNAITNNMARRQQEEQYFREAQMKRVQGTRRMEANRAALLKSGVTESGTGLDVFSDIGEEIALDAQNTEYRGIIERWNAKVDWNRIQSGATLSAYEGTAQRSAANYYGSAASKSSRATPLNMMIAGVGAGLSGASSTFSTYNRLNPPSFGY